MSTNRWQEEKKAVLAASRMMLDKGLVVGTAGNISMRLKSEDGQQLLAITPSSRSYDSLRADDIQIIDFKARRVEGKLTPSMETGLHIGIYRSRDDVNAIIHTHSVFASAVAVSGTDIPPILDDQVAFLGGAIKLAGYARTGSNEQITNVLTALGDRSAAILQNHGAVGTGVSISNAFTACEIIEKTARIYLLALNTGKVNELSSEAIEDLKELYYKAQKDK